MDRLTGSMRLPTEITRPLNTCPGYAALVASGVMDWIHQCLDEQRIEPKNVDVKLLNEEHQPLITWHVIKAYPTKWMVSDLSATNNAVIIETLQLAYQYFTVDRGQT